MQKRTDPADRVHWYGEPRPEPRRPERDRTVETVIVGGGMTGLMCAERLRAAGRDAVVIEAELCGAGASGKSSGFITPDSELELSDLVRQHGPEKARQLWDFAKGGVAAIRAQILEHGFECDFQVQDSLFVATSEDGAKVVRAEHAAQEQLGYTSEIYDKKALAAIVGTDSYFAAIRYPETFGIDAYRYCRALSRRLDVYEDTPVTAILDDGVATPRAKITAKNVVVCTDRLLPELRVAEDDIYHVQTFLAVSSPLSDAAVLRLFPRDRMMVWDTNTIYTYFRITGDQRLLIGSGNFVSTYAAHEIHDPHRFAKKIDRYLLRRFPGLDVRLSALWPGLIGISKDFAPIAGREAHRPHVLYAGSAAGLPWAAALGGYLAEKIIDGRSDLDAFFSRQRRFPVSRRVQAVVGKRAAFAMSHGMAKYLRK